jgi:glycosyltransferase involved in cell wall biosynthesis
MIVKNEAHVMRRCIDSVRPLIDYWVIVDTGSTDGTQDVIRSALADLPGMLVERPWVDFASNRSEALALARPHGSYSLIIDADDELVIPAGFTLPKLDAPGYAFTIQDTFTRYARVQLVDNAVSWYYRGVLHEFLDCQQITWTKPLPLAMRRGEDGARHRDPQTFRRDVAVLEEALSSETDPFLISRYTFYLAQSYRDAGEMPKALEYYLRRADLGFWHEEIYISVLSAAYIEQAMGKSDERVFGLYDRAIAICPYRAEAYHGASRCCRERGSYVKGLQYAQEAMPLKMPGEGLFIQPWIYAYGLRDEHAVNAFYTGQHRACLAACLDILDQPDVPPDVRTRSVKMLRAISSKMIEPIWGCQQSAYTSEFLPLWQGEAA